MNVLITGHMGFVGRHFVSYFNKNNIKFIGIDIKEGNDCRDFFKTSTEQFDLIIHLAAIVGGRATIEGEPLSVATDLSIDAELFNWAINTNQKHIVYFSSSAAYPIRKQLLADEYLLKESDIDLNAIESPDFTYGWAKLTGEYLAEFMRKKGVRVDVFRPFSGYGEDQDLDYPFPSFVKRVVNREDPFIIWGTGNQVRDFIHIKDIIESVMHFVTLEAVPTLNLGWGRPTSFKNLAEIMFNISGWRPKEVIYLEDKPMGVEYRCCNPNLFFQYYRPKISLEEGVRRSLEFFIK
jgi:nucleoside-diphosphate-sugar epimerase